jgi:pyruvate formate lyase activating enzyme
MTHFGLQTLSLIDFPETVAAVIFIPGCNLRCPYCHNPGLVTNIDKESLFSFDYIKAFLEKRRNVLAGICISGGEPLLYDGLPDLINTIRSFGLKVKIDTNGTLPGRLAGLQADYIAMDIKTSPDKYHLLGGAGTPGIREKLKGSIEWIVSSQIPYEFRTTVAPGIVTKDDIREICSLIKGAKQYVLTQFRPVNTLDPGFENYQPTSNAELHEMQEIARLSGIPCSIRFSVPK